MDSSPSWFSSLVLLVSPSDVSVLRPPGVSALSAGEEGQSVLNLIEILVVPLQIDGVISLL